jgi:hypothetical protein
MKSLFFSLSLSIPFFGPKALLFGLPTPLIILARFLLSLSRCASAQPDGPTQQPLWPSFLRVRAEADGPLRPGPFLSFSRPHEGLQPASLGPIQQRKAASVADSFSSLATPTGGPRLPGSSSPSSRIRLRLYLRGRARKSREGSLSLRASVFPTQSRGSAPI